MFNKIKVVFSHHFIQIIGRSKRSKRKLYMFMVKEVGIKPMLPYFGGIQRNNIELLCYSIAFSQAYIHSKMCKPVTLKNSNYKRLNEINRSVFYCRERPLCRFDF